MVVKKTHDPQHDRAKWLFECEVEDADWRPGQPPRQSHRKRPAQRRMAGIVFCPCTGHSIRKEGIGTGTRMANENYSITYSITPSLSFSSRSAAERHLEKEEEIWAGFLEEVAKSSRSLNAYNRQIAVSQQANTFQNLRSSLDDARQFRRLTEGPQSATFPPPPHDTLEGQLILGLFEGGRTEDAMSVYIWFISRCLSTGNQNDRNTQANIDRGHALWTAAVASSVLPFHQVSSKKIAGAARRAENQLEALNDKFAETDAINTRHEEALSDLRDQWSDKARRLVRIVARRESRRKENQKAWVEKNDAEIAELLLSVEQRIQGIDDLNKKQQDAREADFQHLKDLFETQLRLRAPVQLWGGRERLHRTAARWAMARFLLSTTVALLIGVLVPLCAGDYIAESFFTEVCDPADATSCERAFSAKGPLTITGLLLVLSLVMWVTRLQYRVFLSERHLSLDASEKKAFAETYLAMKEGEDVGSGNEAIVLAALFRPTQDGIIKDDESGVDLSAAAILAKQLGQVK